MPDPTASGVPGEPAPFAPSPVQLPASSGTPGLANQAENLAGTSSRRDGGTPPIAQQVKQRATGFLGSQKDAAADAIEQLAEAVHRSGEQLVGKQDWVASAITRGGAELNALAGSLREQDVADLAHQLRSFANSRPAVFAFAAFAAGFAAARVGKVAAGDLSRDDLPEIRRMNHGQR